MFLIYRNLVRPFLKSLTLVFVGPINECRFVPSCSQYSQESIVRFGFFKGSFLSLRRICHCHPWSTKDPIDLVPKVFQFTDLKLFKVFMQKQKVNG